MSEIKSGNIVDGDITKTGAVPQIRQDRRVPSINKPRQKDLPKQHGKQ